MQGNIKIKGTVKKKLFENASGGLSMIFYREGKPVAVAYGLQHVKENGLDLLTYWTDYTKCAASFCGWADEKGQSDDNVTLNLLVQYFEKSGLKEVAKYDGYKITIYPDHIGPAAVKFIKS